MAIQSNISPPELIAAPGAPEGSETSERQAPKLRRETPIWVTATGSWETRVKKAKYYLQWTAWIPGDAAELSTALLIVVCNLRRYFRLQGPFTATLIQEHYAPRLMSRVDEFQAWSTAEILEKYRIAGKRGMYPTLGVSDERAKKKVKRLELYQAVRAFLKRYMRPGGSCTPKELLDAFNAYRGGAAANSNAFGRAVVAITGIRTITPFGKRTYRGFQLSETAMGLTKDQTNNASAA